MGKAKLVVYGVGGAKRPEATPCDASLHQLYGRRPNPTSDVIEGW